MIHYSQHYGVVDGDGILIYRSCAKVCRKMVKSSRKAGVRMAGVIMAAESYPLGQQIMRLNASGSWEWIPAAERK